MVINPLGSEDTKKKASAGKRFVNKIWNDILIPSATSAAKTVAQNYFTNLGNNVINGKSKPKITKIDNIDVNKLTDSQLSDVISRINNTNNYENYAKSNKKKK